MRGGVTARVLIGKIISVIHSYEMGSGGLAKGVIRVLTLANGGSRFADRLRAASDAHLHVISRPLPDQIANPWPISQRIRRARQAWTVKLCQLPLMAANCMAFVVGCLVPSTLNEVAKDEVPSNFR
jgi:hypothetical protein